MQRLPLFQTVLSVALTPATPVAWLQAIPCARSTSDISEAAGRYGRLATQNSKLPTLWSNTQLALVKVSSSTSFRQVANGKLTSEAAEEEDRRGRTGGRS